MKEELIALGKVIESDFENLVSQQITGWLINDSLSDADWRQLGELEAELADLFAINDQFAALEAWLTSGFIPTELPDFDLGKEEWTAETRGENLQSFPVSSYTRSNSTNATGNKVTESFLGYAKPTESSAVATSSADRKPVENLGVAKNQDDSDGVSILPTLKNQGMGETPIPQNKSIHSDTPIPQNKSIDFVNRQPENLTQPKLRSPLGLKELATVLEADTSITDFEEVKSTTLAEVRAPLGLKELATVLEADTSITDVEEVKSTTLSEVRSPLGLKELATVLEADTSITDVEEVKSTTLAEVRAPLGLKDLAKFLAADTVINQPEIETGSTAIVPSQNSGYGKELDEEEKISWTDLISKSRPQTDNFSFERDRVTSYPDSSQNPQIAELFHSNQPPEFFSEEQQQERELSMEIEQDLARDLRNISAIDMDVIIEAIAEEINREYRRFYGC